MRPALVCILLLLTAGCTQEARERAARNWCSSASNCTVYDENGRETSSRELCRGNHTCGSH
jgi:hypothetical protein